MSQHRKTWVVCAAGWVALVVGLAREGAARAADDAKENKVTLMTIGHALEMGIEGCTLNFAARETDAAKGTLSRVAESVGTNRNKEQWSSLKELRDNASKAFADSRDLLRTASKELGDADARSAARRFFDAANQYVGTLESVAGERTDQANPPDQATKTGSKTGGPWKLSAEDVAAVAVINHAIKDFHTGFVLRKALEKTESGGAAAEKLRQHAQQMETAATQCVQRYLAANQNANTSAPNATTPREKPVDRSIMMVAQHAQAVIQAIQQWDKNQ